MSALRQAASDYLTVRRAPGSGLEGYPRLPDSFITYLENAGAGTVTTELAVAWARLPGNDAHPSCPGKRLCVVRGFARHLQAFDPAAEVPPAGLLPGRKCRAVPYPYSEAGIAALMTAAGSLAPALRAATYQTLAGLLAVSGLRTGGLPRPGRDDIDGGEGLLVIRDPKVGKSREVPPHPSTAAALAGYARLRDELCPRPATASFPVSPAGARLACNTVQRTFARLARDAGLPARPERCRPRLHDARHSFAPGALLSWYRADASAGAQMPLLSAYPGHGRPSGTYWYASAVPGLLALAAGRREHFPGTRP